MLIDNNATDIEIYPSVKKELNLGVLFGMIIIFSITAWFIFDNKSKWLEWINVLIELQTG